ncbi:hypothetical protein BDK51DRAFT_52518 [Blyttiomyces helicus]|uniref:HCP-like protein n=1 Tax=Blyttiomyces helicus TaxID=388810 RepID=A0A4P9W1J5_9FUNG|nr:hypothetical protein BDK51DRAFT_52518 [Blyttiomyces helicus]|eukprot:RKO85974.1 hypothetical protein BDK51DRAFT_52518 [Blyttiomyces helicus]
MTEVRVAKSYLALGDHDGGQSLHPLSPLPATAGCRITPRRQDVVPRSDDRLTHLSFTLNLSTRKGGADGDGSLKYRSLPLLVLIPRSSLPQRERTTPANAALLPPGKLNTKAATLTNHRRETSAHLLVHPLPIQFPHRLNQPCRALWSLGKLFPEPEPGPRSLPRSVKAFGAVCGAYSGRVLDDDDRREQRLGRISGFWEVLKQLVMARSSSAPLALPSSEADADIEVLLPWVVQTEPPPPAPVIPLRAGPPIPAGVCSDPDHCPLAPPYQADQTVDPPAPVLAFAKQIFRVDDEGVCGVRAGGCQNGGSRADRTRNREAHPRAPPHILHLSPLGPRNHLRESNILGLVALCASPSTPLRSTSSTKRSPLTSHAASLFEAAIERGYPKPALNAAICHHPGIGGANRDTERAIVLFRRATHAGYLPAEYNPGVMLLDLAQEQNSGETWNEAIGWIESAAHHGFELAFKAVRRR